MHGTGTPLGAFFHATVLGFDALFHHSVHAMVQTDGYPAGSHAAGWLRCCLHDCTRILRLKLVFAKLHLIPELAHHLSVIVSVSLVLTAGDPIEVGAALAVLQGGQTPLALSAAKSRLGHAEPAAGALGMLQVGIRGSICVNSVACYGTFLRLCRWCCIYTLVRPAEQRLQTILCYHFDAGITMYPGGSDAGARHRAGADAPAQRQPSRQQPAVIEDTGSHMFICRVKACFLCDAGSYVLTLGGQADAIRVSASQTGP